MKRTIQFTIDPSEELTVLTSLTRVFCSAVRHAFNRLGEGANPKELIKQINCKFHLNKRYAEDAVLKAQTIISSQKALVPLRIEEVQAKISKTEKKLEAYQTGKKKPKKAPLALCLVGLEARLTKLRKKEEELLEHQKNGTIPKVIFGGRKHFMDRLKGKLSKEEWKALRSNTLYSRGDRSKKGNLNIRMVWNETGQFFQLEVANPLHSTKRVAERIILKVHVPETLFHEVTQVTLPQETFVKNKKGNGKMLEHYEPYTIELKLRNGRCVVLLTYDTLVYGKELKNREDISAEYVAGIDINIDRVAVSILTREGRRIESKTFYCHEMEYVNSNRRSNLAGEMVKTISDYLLSRNVGAFVVEDLKLKQTHDTNSTFNRKTASFAYRKMHKALLSRGLKDGFMMKQVNPAYTSVIGRFKYSRMYGLSVHEAASFVIGRRGLGLDEKVPKALLHYVKEKVKPHLAASLRSMEESEEGSKNGTAKRAHLRLLLTNIDHFKERHNWSLWNVIHKTLRMKNQDILLLEEV